MVINSSYQSAIPRQVCSVLLPILFIVCTFIPARADTDPWAALQKKQAVISKIDIRVSNVFDLNKPEEDHFIGKAANFIHIRTRPSVVTQTILFKEGDRVNARIIHESERLLRDLTFVRDASIKPVVSKDGKVTAVVSVHDAWSIRGGAKFHHVGGESAWRLRLDEANLLGYGKRIIVSHEKDFERTTEELGYIDPHLFGSRWTLNTNYQKLSDGEGKLFAMERPFYALETGWSAGLSAASYRSRMTLYNNTNAAYRFPSDRSQVSLYAAWQYAGSDRTVERIGAGFLALQHRYGDLIEYRPWLLPGPDISNRRFRGPYISWELSQDHYRTYTNMAAIGRTEDYNLGWDTSLKAGIFLRSLGSMTNAPFYELKLTKGFVPGDDDLILWRAASHGRRQDGEYRDIFGRTSLTYYNQRFHLQTLAFNAEITVGSKLDPEDYLYLGGSDGLRGYPNHLKAGDKRWKVSFEDRVVTSKTLWGLLQVGYVAYIDASGIRNFRTGSMSKTYSDVGFGFRFGNVKSAFGRVLLVTIAFPLVKGPGIDNYQIVVGNVIRF